MKNVIQNKQGTALLVALLVMGVLIAISLSLSVLILRETQITKDLLDSGRAYYAAESGVEVAMYKLKNSLPGWETEKKEYVALKLGEDLRAVGEYRVNNTCNAYPCFDEGFDKDSAPVTAYYDVLDLNETITIPLFVDGKGNVEDFTVEYYTTFNPKEHLKIESDQLNGWDVLRWKIYGIYDKPGLEVTESISDFTAVSLQKGVVTEEDIPSHAQKPSWFGSVNCDQINNPYNAGIECGTYVDGLGNTEEVKINGQKASLQAGLCWPTEAREYYWYGGDQELDSDDIKTCYSIKQFLDEHKLNYLTLTNMMNPAVFKNDLDLLQTNAFSKIYFRIEMNGETAREYADITANGYSGSVKQSINVKMQKGSFMPVFNFSLYSTYDDGIEGN